LEVKDGEVVVLLGKNGMGKSTAMKSIMGISPPAVRSGKIRFGDTEITHWLAYRVSRLGIGYVPEDRRIFPLLTVKENLRIGLDVFGVVKEMKKNMLEKIYGYFPRLEQRLSQLGESLSGGEQQMLAIARAMVMNPRLILMDEPTEGLMPLLVEEIKEIIKVLRQNGVSVLLVEQSAAMALEVTDRVYVMEKGTIRFEGTPKEFRDNEALMKELLGV
jgi:branched-chain amino acid transport system ATP-binding protein